jgi:uncharacterized protein (TIGR02285 family)
MKFLTLFFILFWGTFGVAEMSAPEKGKIVWVLPDWPASPLGDGAKAQAKANVFVRLTEQLQEALPQYDHHLIRGNADKAMRLWKEGKNICALPVLKTKERMDLAQMSAFVVFPPYRVIVKNSQVSSMLAKRDTVSFQNLMTSKNLKGGLIVDRSYGETIDRYLSETKDYKNWTLIEPHDGWETVLSMVQNGRFDYTIEMAEFVRYFNKKNSPSTNLVALPMQESASALISYVACNRNKWGTEIIKLVDKRMQVLASKKEFTQNLETLFHDDGLKDFKQDLQEFVQKRAEGPWMFVSAPIEAPAAAVSTSATPK